MEPIYGQAGTAVIILGVVTVLGYWLFGTNQRVVEYLIATESEMKKVNWSTKREIMGSTWVVIGFTAFLALACPVRHRISVMFQAMKVLETAAEPPLRRARVAAPCACCVNNDQTKGGNDQRNC
jgi:preprotein translocase SecE subunit